MGVELIARLFICNRILATVRYGGSRSPAIIDSLVAIPARAYALRRVFGAFDRAGIASAFLAVVRGLEDLS